MGDVNICVKQMANLVKKKIVPQHYDPSIHPHTHARPTNYDAVIIPLFLLQDGKIET